jgi:putative transposase
MPSRLTRYQKDGHYHAINFTCYRQRPWLQDDHACIAFEETLEDIRKRHDFYLFGYVVMPTHVHLLLSEPKRHALATTISVLKGETSKRLKGDRKQFWQTRYYDFNVFTHSKFVEKLRYIAIPSKTASSKSLKTGSGAASATTLQVNTAAWRSNPRVHGTCANGAHPECPRRTTLPPSPTL